MMIGSLRFAPISNLVLMTSFFLLGCGFPLFKTAFVNATPLSQIAQGETKIQVNKITVLGSSIFTPETFTPLVEPYEGQSVSLSELEALTDKITQLYLDRNYITSDAILVQDSLKTGNIQIQIIEGSIEKIEVEGISRVDRKYIVDRIALGTTTPFSTSKLEDQLRLLRNDPLFTNVEASLRQGEGLNQSILVVRVKEAHDTAITGEVNNFSPPSVGSESYSLTATHRNLTGRGDSLAINLERTTTGGTNQWNLNYSIPINPMNGTITLNTLFNQNKITQSPFNILNITGNYQKYELTYRQPLLRSPRQEFALSLGFAVQDGQTFIFDTPFAFGFGPDSNGNTRTRVLKFGQDYINRQPNGTWAVQSTFSLGLGWFNATDNTLPIPDGQFFSWLGQIQRLQIIDPDNYLILQSDIQLTPNGLLPSQQFTIGGGQSIRGYRQNILSADNGIRFSVEHHWIMLRDTAGKSVLELSPFWDIGTVFNSSGNPNQLTQKNTVLSGLGLGLVYHPFEGLNMRLDYAFPLIPVENKGENAQDKGFYFDVNYQL